MDSCSVGKRHLLLYGNPWEPMGTHYTWMKHWSDTVNSSGGSGLGTRLQVSLMYTPLLRCNYAGLCCHVIWKKLNSFTAGSRFTSTTKSQVLHYATCCNPSWSWNSWRQLYLIKLRQTPVLIHTQLLPVQVPVHNTLDGKIISTLSWQWYLS